MRPAECLIDFYEAQRKVISLVVKLTNFLQTSRNVKPSQFARAILYGETVLNIHPTDGVSDLVISNLGCTNGSLRCLQGKFPTELMGAAAGYHFGPDLDGYIVTDDLCQSIGKQ